MKPSVSVLGVMSPIAACATLVGQRIRNEWMYEPESACGESGNDANAL